VARRQASRFVRRVARTVELRPEGHRSVAQQEQRCSAGFRDAAAVLRLEVRCQRAAPALRRGQQEQARQGVQAADLCPARPSVAAARMVRVLPKAAEVTVAQPRAAGAVVQRLVPPAVRAVAAAQGVPRVPEASAARPKAAGVARAEWGAAVGPQPVVVAA
jgi:hypothetical protein